LKREYPIAVDQRAVNTHLNSLTIPTTSRGQIDYQLAKESVIREFRRGRLSKADICDAQPELLRVARSVGVATSQPCPICEQQSIVHVVFGFGTKLPKNGRFVANWHELQRLSKSHKKISCYLVEVCTNCEWNYLLRMFAKESKVADSNSDTQ
jgi:hypothetical protein